MAFLELENISKYFGRNIAVDHINLAVEHGEFLTLLGPSGCGKTTILRMIAGFEVPSEGYILLDGEDITQRAASKRPMGMVFQSYALFPHLTAEQNIAFGMSIKHLPKETIRKRCTELLELVGLGDKGRSYPHQLSGGQQQRVALAISDRIAVMAKGHIEQLDQPEEIYSNPRTIFAASFVGSSNQFRGKLESASQGLCRVADQLLHVPPAPTLKDGDAVLVLVRPEEVTLQRTDAQNDASSNTTDNHIAGVIELRTFLGPFTRFHVRTEQGASLTADIPSQQARENFVAQHVILSFAPEACQVLPLDAEEAKVVKQAEAEAV